MLVFFTIANGLPDTDDAMPTIHGLIDTISFLIEDFHNDLDIELNGIGGETA